MKTILAARSLGGIVGCMRASGQLREGDRRDCDLCGQRALRNALEFDDDGRVDQTAGMPSVRHAASCPGPALRLRRIEIGPAQRRGAGEYAEHDASGDELSGSDRCQLADWDAVAGDEKGLTTVRLAHDFAARIAEL